MDVARIRTAIAVFAGLALSGCTLGPDFQRPASPQADRYTEAPVPEATVAAPGTGGASQRLIPGADLPAQWWTLFRSEPLDALIKDALAESPTLASAQAALRVAQENLAVGRGDLLYPAIDGRASATRQQISGSTLGAPGLGTSLFTLYNASVNVSYAFDVFGGARREIEALESLVDYQGYQLEGAHLALTSNVVTTAIREAALRAQVRSTQEIIAALEKQLTVVERQFKLGAVSKPDVLAQRTQLAQTRATLPAARAQSRADAASARGAGRPPAERRRAAAVRARLADAAAGNSAERALVAGAPASRYPGQRSAPASGERRDRRRHRQPVSQDHSDRQLRRTGTQDRGPLRRASVWSIGAGLLQPIFQRRRAERQAPRGDCRLRPGRGAVPADRAARVPERRRHPARARRRRPHAQRAGRRRSLRARVARRWRRASTSSAR